MLVCCTVVTLPAVKYHLATCVCTQIRHGGWSLIQRASPILRETCWEMERGSAKASRKVTAGAPKPGAYHSVPHVDVSGDGSSSCSGADVRRCYCRCCQCHCVVVVVDVSLSLL